MLTLYRRIRTACVFCLISTLAIIIPTATQAAGNDYGTAAYTIIDNASGAVLASYNGHKKRQIASLTKIATAKIVLDWAKAQNADLTQWVIIPPEAVSVGGTNPIGLLPGDAVSIRDLIYCALLQSDNIAAYALVNHVGRNLLSVRAQNDDLGPVGIFVSQMNALARRLGMEHTLFLNPHGIEPTEGTLPYSTSDDIAKLTKYAMEDKGFQFYVSQKERKITIMRAMQPLQYLLRNTNELLGVSRVDGVKTGRTARAGDCLVLSASDDPDAKQVGGKVYVTPRRVSVVILGANDRFSSGRQLIERAWQLERDWIAAGRPSKNW